MTQGQPPHGPPGGPPPGPPAPGYGPPPQLYGTSAPGGPPPGYGAPPGFPSAAPNGYGSAPTPTRAGRTGVIVLVCALALLLLAALVGGIFWLRSGTTVEDLTRGDCLTWSADENDLDDAENLDEVSCADPHDAEVMFAGVVGSDGLSGDGVVGTCQEQLSAQLADWAEQGIEVRPVTKDGDADEGAVLLCVARKSDGSRVDAAIG